jgi:hypothetical protein
VGPASTEASEASELPLPLPAGLAAEAPCEGVELDDGALDDGEFDDGASAFDAPAEGDDELGPGPSDADGSAALIPGPVTRASPMPAAATTPLMPYARLSTDGPPNFDTHDN